MFVLKYGNKYARFGSYCQMTLVDRPEQATLYTRYSDLVRRRSKPQYLGQRKVESSVLQPFEVAFTFIERLVGQD